MWAQMDGAEMIVGKNPNALTADRRYQRGAFVP